MKKKLFAVLAAGVLSLAGVSCTSEKTVTVKDTVEVVKLDTVQKVVTDTQIVNGDTVVTQDTLTIIDTVKTGSSSSIATTDSIYFDGDTITDESINEGEKVYLAPNKEYILSGFVYVEDKAEIHIPAGTVIKGLPGQGADASALIVARGGKIYAEGTKDKPIIFTASSDDISDPTDLLPTDQGLWGGLIVLGKAPLNFISNDGSIGAIGGEANVEGIPETELRGRYGGSDPEDNSGVIKYVSIRHGGSVIGADNEINGLSLGAVGSGTTIDYLEVFANKDDGIEFFGSTVGVKHACITYCGDDSFDYDQSFRGKGQFWFTMKNKGDKCGEHDGGPSSNETGTPYAIPTIYNATYIGNGVDNATDGTQGVIFRDNAGGHYINSIFANIYGNAIQFEDLESGGDSRTMLENGDLTIENSIFYNIGAKTGSPVTDINKVFCFDFHKWTPDSLYELQAIAQLDSAIATWNNQIADPKIPSYDINMINPVPTVNVTSTNLPTDSWFDNVDYVGAFKTGDNWLKGWTALDKYGLLQ